MLIDGKIAISQPIGVLGTGYLGKVLLQQFQWPVPSWGTYHYNPIPDQTGYGEIFFLKFDWTDVSTWENLPTEQVVLVLTIPPVIKEVDAERHRLGQWVQWMRAKRPQLNKIVYISSTSVYPAQDKVWQEKDDFQPDHITGQLRIETEALLSRHFQTYIIRAGGIYGKGRHIAQRIMNRQPISVSRRPIHRVHVVDLAYLVKFLVEADDAPYCINAVDKEPKASIEVVEWLLYKKFIQLPQESPIQYTQNEMYSTGVRHQTNQRFISNKLLVEEIGFSYKFPTFREGLTHILQSHD